jgi:hemerythrin-like domain-containing protein
MPNPIECLRNEHGACRVAFRLLLSVADHLARGLPFPADDCAVLLRFLRDYVEGVHNRKEVDHVLPALAVYGDETTVELVGLLLGQEQQSRDLLLALILFWEPVAALTPAERAGFVAAARAYASRSLDAMAVEERRLFPLAERAIPADDRLGWARAFGTIEAGRPSLQDWQPVLAQLAARWH